MSALLHQYPSNRRDPRDSAYVSRTLFMLVQYLYNFTNSRV